MTSMYVCILLVSLFFNIIISYYYYIGLLSWSKMANTKQITNQILLLIRRSTLRLKFILSMMIIIMSTCKSIENNHNLRLNLIIISILILSANRFIIKNHNLNNFALFI